MRSSFRPLSSLGTRSRTIARRRLSCPISTAGFSNVLAHITELRKLARVLSSDDYDNDNDTTAYLTDWTGRYIQESGAVCLPKNMREVSDVVRYCHQNNIAVVPQGGNTGLVGGGVGLDGSLVINMQRMNTIHDVDTVSGILTCDAGCILQNLDTYLLENRQNTETETTNFMLPISMGSKSQCHIGGNIATNAGGLNVIKYGPIGRYLLGAEVVMADGAVLDMLRALPKDNMGYQLKSLLVGSEGTLGIITKVKLMLVSRPKQTATVLLGIPAFTNIAQVLESARNTLGTDISAFEFFDAESVVAVAGTRPSLLKGLPLSIPTEGGAISLLAGIATESGTVVPNSATQETQLWQLREGIPVSLMQFGPGAGAGRLYKYDISLTLSQMDEIVALLREQLRSEGFFSEDSLLNVSIANFGHCGDLNLHLNVLAETQNELERLQSVLDCAVAELVTARNGSLSAEHGVGQLKRDFMPAARGEVELGLMRSIKLALDPRNILNPGKVLPP
eukprot:GSChrysophyteH2.ASY1.ANO1.293.1 assembled CDS